jgi:general secretion pathway protein K
MRSQRGLAVVTALLIVAVAAAAAALMLSQQSAMLDQTAMVANRAQADAYAQAGFDWARGVLTEDQRGGGIDHLGEGWAQPMAGLPVERAVVSGAIVDEQGKLNLNNLVDENGRRSEADMDNLRRLLASVGLAPELAEATLDWIDADGAGAAEDAYYLSLPRPYRAANQAMRQVEELYRVRGFDAKAVARIRPFVTALPRGTKVNANTASIEVLGAILHEVPAEQWAPFAAERRKQPLRTSGEIGKSAGPKADASAIARHLDVKSGYFQVSVLVVQDEVQVAGDALVERGANAATVMIWRRPRF